MGQKAGKAAKDQGGNVAQSGPSTEPTSGSTGTSTSGSSGTSSSAAGPRGTPQFTIDEAVALQLALKNAFAEANFQTLLRRAEAQFPHRGHRGHPDQLGFTPRLQGLILHVLRTVMPQKPWCLQPGWDGFREMSRRMAAVWEEPRIRQNREEINRLLGLPKGAVLKAPAEEPLVVPTPDGSGAVPQYDVPLTADADGDFAHEFWEEDRGGKLLQRAENNLHAKACT